MTELLAPRPGDRILEIGTGSGYQAAILATLGADVTTHRAPRRTSPRLRASGWPSSGSASAVDVRVGDGSLGDPDGAPWDGIIVTAAAPAIPTALREQLADGGRLVIPVGPRDRQILTLVDAARRRVARAPGRRRACSSRSSARAASPS